MARKIRIEKLVRALLVAKVAGVSATSCGRDMRFDGVNPYVQISKVYSQSQKLEAAHTIDIEVYAPSFVKAESLSLDIEDALLGYPHEVEVDGQRVVFDRVSQNVGPRELPWEAERETRLGATYVITVRRY